MRFEVEVDDGAGLAALHKAREAYNATNAQVSGFVPAEDLPTYVQRLMDKAVGEALAPLGPTTLPAALAKINELQAANATLQQEVATAQAAPAVQASPAEQAVQAP